METARERAIAFLYGRRGVGVPPRPAAVHALCVAGLLGENEAERWLTGREAEPALRLDDGMRAQAAALLEELLGHVPAGDDGLDADLNRFEGALGALAEIGAVEYDPWDARMGERLGWPSAEEEMREHAARGATERDLVAVLPGPDEVVDGVRLMYALRFADGVSIVLRRQVVPDPEDDDFWEAELELRDDAGTGYFEAGGSGGSEEMRISFETAPPERASWIELVGAAATPFRVWL
jgi:hypothetical protein